MNLSLDDEFDVDHPHYIHGSPSLMEGMIMNPTDTDLVTALLSSKFERCPVNFFPPHWKYLKVMDLRHQGLTTLSDRVQAFENLVALDLSGNGFEHFPVSLLSLKLVRLSLGGNKISRVPDAIGQMISLEILYLGGNLLEVIPESIGSLTRLSSLNLADNRLTSVPASLGRLTRLKSLQLHLNQITALPAELLWLPLLDSVSIRNNPLITHVQSVPHQPISLLAIAARAVAKFPEEQLYPMLPAPLIDYLEQGMTCPACYHRFFESINRINFVGFYHNSQVPVILRYCSNDCARAELA